MSKTNLESKIELLIHIMNTKGVQPSELVDNIFLDEYISLSFNKSNSIICGEIKYEEKHGQITIPVTLLYKYNENKEVIEITESIDGVSTVVWDRIKKETDLINEIAVMASAELTTSKYYQFIDSLPEELAKKINEIGKKTA